MDPIEEVLGEHATTPIEPYVEELATSRELPNFAIALCTVRYQDSGPFLRAALERAASGGLTDEQEERLFLRALFIIGGRRDPLGFEPLLRLLRRPQEEVENLLGDAVSGHLPRIAAGVFNGDTDALLDAVVDPQLEETIRDSLLAAAAFLTWDGRIERELMIAFLRRFDAERLAPDDDLVWAGWANMVALLGLRELEPAVLAAFDRGSIPAALFGRDDFTEELERAEQAPDDIQRFEDVLLGYIDDVIVALEDHMLVEDFDDDDDVPDWDVLDDLRMPTDKRFPLSLPGEPAINPLRHVGRNDPCPCGSGKKAKRCCLAA
jgi:Protein of unknown function (DUF1186)/SEC-C motif